MTISLSGFHSIPPTFEVFQDQVLKWIAQAHLKAEKNSNPLSSEKFHSDMQEQLFRLGLGHQKIQKRGLDFDDFLHQDWEKMKLFNLDAPASSQDHRSELFDQIVSKKFEQFYSGNNDLPSHLLHVSCTGYVSPSGAQKIVSERGASTSVAHIYHMGCYAAVPAIRFAKAVACSEKKSVDIAHTEICSLHFNPYLHTTEQLLVQTLFADGCIKYTCDFGSEPKKNSFEVLQIHDEILPSSLEKMSWKCKSWGMQMTLHKDIPVLIARALPSFLAKLCKDQGNLTSEAIFAVHPGGPKIVTQIAALLDLKPSQIAHSQNILFSRGNMSSATLPHIWKEILEDPNVENGTPIISLAFGPGLTMCGILLQKR